MNGLPLHLMHRHDRIPKWQHSRQKTNKLHLSIYLFLNGRNKYIFNYLRSEYETVEISHVHTGELVVGAKIGAVIGGTIAHGHVDGGAVHAGAVGLGKHLSSCTLGLHGATDTSHTVEILLHGRRHRGHVRRRRGHGSRCARRRGHGAPGARWHSCGHLSLFLIAFFLFYFFFNNKHKLFFFIMEIRKAQCPFIVKKLMISM
jgi:hypothetical protein